MGNPPFEIGESHVKIILLPLKSAIRLRGWVNAIVGIFDTVC